MARRRTSPVRDPFEVLGVAADADEATIKQAYRRLAAEFHPDRNPAPDASERLKEVVAAWELLSDPDERARCAIRSAGGSDVEVPPSPPPTAAPSYRRSRQPHRPLHPTVREAFIFATVFSQLTGTAGDDDVDDRLDSFFTMLMTFVCAMSLAFYAFQSALPQEFPQPEFDIAAHALRPEIPLERRPAIPPKSERVYDYAGRGFWTWMLMGSVCAFCPRSLAWLLLHLGRIASLRRRVRRRSSPAADLAALAAVQGIVRVAGWIIVCVLPRALPQWLL